MNRFKTPLRYPGGKQKLAPFIREVLRENDLIGGEYAEPYAGGAGVAMELLLDGSVATVHLNDSSLPVYSFWSSIINHTTDFIKLIETASMTVTEWKRQREILRRASEFSELDVGFSLFFLNRCNRSGIPNAGVIGGLEQAGKWKMDARFPRSDLIHRIELIALKKNSIKVYKQDAEDFIKKQIPKTPRNTLVYCDPPYFHKASRLYLDHYLPEDHKHLADTIQTKLKRPWIVSYDSVPEIIGFYAARRHFTYDLQYNAAKAYKGKEVFVFSDKVKVPKSSSIAAVDLAINCIGQR
jgi:DNA adenine methylase